jgi:hypothetical protein
MAETPKALTLDEWLTAFYSSFAGHASDDSEFMAREAYEAGRNSVLYAQPSDPFHDEGNATNHRVSACTERCKPA